MDTQLKEKILSALSNVDDPDLKRDIVSLNMVQNLEQVGNTIKFDLMLTTPACPMKDHIHNACVTAISHLVDANLKVDINITSQKSTQNVIPEDSGIKNVKHIIAVSSGKGGVGKSTIAVNLAIALAKSGAAVGCLDADIYGPSLPTMLGTKHIEANIIQEEKIIIYPYDVYGIKSMSIGNLIPENQALVWRGPMISTALRQLLNDVAWGELDYLVIDMPPGTGDIHLTLAQNFPLDGVIMVTTPQDVALADCRKAISMYQAKGVDVKILGIVENMSYFSPEDSPEKRYYLFGKEGGKKLALEYGTEVLEEFPLYEFLANQSDQGIPAVLHPEDKISGKYLELAGKVARKLSVLRYGG